jgi:hypothetical protein
MEDLIGLIMELLGLAGPDLKSAKVIKIFIIVGWTVLAIAIALFVRAVIRGI